MNFRGAYSIYCTAGTTRRKRQQAASLLYFFGVYIFVWDEELLGMRYRLYKLGLVLCPHKFNVLLIPKHKLEIALNSR